MLSLVKKIILPTFLFSGFLLLYVSHLSRSIYGGDVGDLVTAASVGGVAHPSGYPLFTFLGFLLTHSILARISPAFAVGLISAFAGAGGVVCFYLFTKQLTKNSLNSVVASLILGFSFLYWFYAEVAEVFMLNTFFALVLFLLALLFRQSKKGPVLYLFFFCLGLASTHHSTIILIVPSLFLLIGKQLFLQIKKNMLLILLLLLSFVLGLTPFLYIFIASAHNPIINWDSVHDIPSFFHLILRKDYGTFQAGIFDTPSFAQRLVTLWLYVQYLLFQLTIPTIVLTFLGFWHIFKKDKILFTSLFLAWLLSGPVFLMYAGFPLTSSFIIGAYERFTLLSTVIFLIPFGIGLYVFTVRLASFLPKRHYEVLFTCLFLFIPLMLFVYNTPKTNLASLMIGDTYAKDFLDPLPRNAVLLISGDTQIFNTWYVHYALHDRPDILLYNIGATPVTHNSIADGLKGVSSKNRTEALIKIVRSMSSTRRIFSTTQFQPKTGEKLIWVPFGLVFEMYQDVDRLPDKKSYEMQVGSIWSTLHAPTIEERKNPVAHSLTIAEIPNAYSNSLIATGTFIYTRYQDTDSALSFYKKARDIEPNNDKAYSALGVLYSGIAGKCGYAADNLSQSLALNQYQETPYFLLYTMYLNCFKDKKRASEVSIAYTQLYRKDFQKALSASKDTLGVSSK